MKFQEIAIVVKNQKIAPEYFLLTIKSSRVSKLSKPGQFVMIKCGDTLDPLLRRPISINNIDKKKGTISLLYRVIGKGTIYLSKLKAKDTLDIIGPLGNGFTISKSETSILIGGGAGIAPMLALANEITSKNIYSIIGANCKDAVLLKNELKKSGCKVILTTDDGSCGIKGNTIDALVSIKNFQNASIYACGPRPMLNALKLLSKKNNLNCQVSLEEWMACGVGACNGCTVETINGYKKVCSDGPIFDIKDLV